MKKGILVLGHGSREPGANAEIEGVAKEVSALFPEQVVRCAYVELAVPTLEQGLAALAAECEEVTVAPLFLLTAGHVKNDLPVALEQARRAFPHTRFVAARALGVHPTLVELVLARLGTPSPTTSVILVGRGSSDPDANADFCKLARLCAEGSGFAGVFPAFAGVTRPSLPDALQLAARSRPERLIVAPYLLFAGRLIERMAAQLDDFSRSTPWVPAELVAPLGPDPRLSELLAERIRGAGNAPLPCDTCAYRAPVGGVVDRVGGLKALLWSIRHQTTRAETPPHLHAHAALRKHVLVCGNQDCADRGSLRVLSSIRQQVKDAGRQKDVRVTRTSCMGRCGEGPTLAVYPDGVWYRGVAEADAPELVRDHILGDRLVGRLLDHVMT